MVYLDEKGIKDAFARHLIKHRNYSKTEAAMAVSDFPDAYNLPYLGEEYVDNETINEVDYEKFASIAICWSVGLMEFLFCFYTYYTVEDIPNHKVGEYMKARKLYQVETLDEEDFSSQKDIDLDAAMHISSDIKWILS